MEASSIITQVSKDQHFINSVSDTGTLSSTRSQEHVIYQTQPNRKRNGKCFLRIIFCCLGKKKDKRKTQEFYTDGAGCTDHNRCSYLLPPIRNQDVYKKCMVIDLDETLVHSSFKNQEVYIRGYNEETFKPEGYIVADVQYMDVIRQIRLYIFHNRGSILLDRFFFCKFEPISNADFVVPVEIDGIVHQVYVLKRPHVDQFLKRMGELYECVLFTASLAKYADPVADLLDQRGVFRARLFRESCVFYRGNYVKDLNKLGRELQQIVIVDNSPASYIFHPDNAVPVASWFDDMSDSELLDLIPFFDKLSKMDNVYTVLCHSNHPYNKNDSNLIGPENRIAEPNNHLPPDT